MSKQARIPHYFSEEILIQILLNLPVKSLGKCMCACKAWNSLIKDPSFISSHLNHQKSSGKDNLFLVDNIYTDPGVDVHFDDQEFSKYTHLQLSENQYVFGSCNGLLLLVDSIEYPDNPVLCNPIIGKCVTLPLPESSSDVLMSENSFGVGFDSRTNDYKVLKISGKYSSDYGYPDNEVQLYSLKKNSWKTLAPTKYNVSHECLYGYQYMAFACGVVHFVTTSDIVDGDWCLVGFDLSDEVFKEIILPENLRNATIRSGVWLKVLPYAELSSIAVIANYDNGDCDVWIMKKYGVIETWTKIYSLERSEQVPFSCIIGFKKNGGLIESCPHKVGRDPHVMEYNEIKNVKIGLCVDFVFSYVETLVLLDHVSENGAKNGSSASNSIKGATDDFTEHAASDEVTADSSNEVTDDSSDDVTDDSSDEVTDDSSDEGTDYSSDEVSDYSSDH